MKVRLLLLFIIISVFPAFGQRTVSGVVTSAEDNLPVIGASVIIKGTSTGTVTDIGGKYVIAAVPENATLEFSFVGMTTQSVKADKAVINMVLHTSAININEVVVTAMGVKSEKKKLNFAVQTLNADELTASKSENFLSALQGKIAGVSVTDQGGTPNGATSLVIRAISSVNPQMSNEPLLILDGMRIGGGAGSINPKDIENVTVLKGAAASALYGQDAASGVIMITTKSAAAGTLAVNASASMQVDNAIRVPKIQSLWGPGARGVYKDFTMGGWGPFLQPGEKVYDNVNNYLQTGTMQKYDLSMSGGTDKFNAYASVTYNRHAGIVPNDYLNRLGIMAKGAYNISKTVSLNVMANVINSTSRSAGSSMGSVYNWPINDDMSNYLNPDGTIRWLYLSPYPNKGDSPVNPYVARYIDKGKTESTRNILQGALIWKAFKGFELTGRLSYDQTMTVSESTKMPRFQKSDFPVMVLDDGSTINTLATVSDFSLFGSYSVTNGKNSILTPQLLVTYSLSFSKDWTLNLLAGTEAKLSDGFSSSMYGADFQIPGGSYSIQNTGTVNIGQDLADNHQTRRMYSYYGEARVEYKNIAQLSASYRNDRSSTVDPDKSSYYYPSFTGGVIFTELFKIGSDFFPFGKLRGNWARVGKDALPYQFDQKFNQKSTFPDGGYGINPIFSVAQTLAPEMTDSWEIGADLRFFQNKTRLDVAYYSTTVNNQIVQVRVSPSTGTILQTRNEGALQNRGVEVTWDQDIIKKRDFQWTVNANFALNRGKVVSLPDQIVELDNTSAQIGEIYPAAYLHGSTTAISGKDYLHAPDGKILCDANGNPMIDPQKGLLIGNREPLFMVGISSNLKYKDISLSLLFNIRKGGDVVNGTSRYLLMQGQSKALETYRNRQILIDGEVQQADGSYLPNTKPVIFDQLFLNNYYIPVSTNIIEDGSFIRLGYVTLTYDLTRLVKHTAFKGLNVSITGKNLFLLTKYTGSDPQVNIGYNSGSGSMGMDYLGVPSTRSFNFSINAVF